MAKNRTMAAKHAKAKKQAMCQKIQDDFTEMCATRNKPHTQSVIWNMKHIPYT